MLWKKDTKNKARNVWITQNYYNVFHVWETVKGSGFFFLIHTSILIKYLYLLHIDSDTNIVYAYTPLYCNLQFKV